jgi:hypothetical protein
MGAVAITIGVSWIFAGLLDVGLVVVPTGCRPYNIVQTGG